MTTFTFSAAADHSGLTVEAPSGATGTLAWRTGSAHDAVAAAVLAAFKAVQGETASKAADLKPEALVRAVRHSIGTHAPSAFRAMRDGVQAAKRDHASRLAKVTVAPSDPLLAAEDRAAFRAVPAAQHAAWINSATLDQLAAVMSAGRERWPGVTDQMWTMAQERALRLAHVSNSGSLARFPLPETPSDPAPVGPDLAAAEAAAAEAVEAFRGEQDDARQAERFLASTIALVAVAGDMTVEEAHALLRGAA